MPADISREQRIHLALWRKCLADSGLTIQLTSERECVSLRLAMYRSASKYRFDEFSEPLIYEALQNYAITVDKAGKRLVFKPKITLGLSEQAMKDLGLSEMDLLSPEEQAMQDRLFKEMDGLIQKEPEAPLEPNKVYPVELEKIPLRRPNKFY